MSRDLALAAALLLSAAILSAREVMLCYRWIRNIRNNQPPNADYGV